MLPFLIQCAGYIFFFFLIHHSWSKSDDQMMMMMQQVVVVFFSHSNCHTHTQTICCYVSSYFYVFMNWIQYWIMMMMIMVKIWWSSPIHIENYIIPIIKIDSRFWLKPCPIIIIIIIIIWQVNVHVSQYDDHLSWIISVIRDKTFDFVLILRAQIRST